MIWQFVAAALVSAALSGIGTWNVQNWRYGAKEKERVEQQLADEREASFREHKRIENVVQATNSARAREAGLRAAADSARTELGGLRSSSDEALRAGSASLEACIVGATAFSGLLNQCGQDLTGLSAKADRHVSDIKTLMDAWPKP